MSALAVRVALVAAVCLGVAGCTDNDAADNAKQQGGGEVLVESTDTECLVSEDSAPSGSLVFSVENTGDEVTEFYFLADDGLRILGEVENIGPGITRKLVVSAAPGDYVTACKPGMVGDGIQGAFTVTDSGESLADGKAIGELYGAASGQYEAFVRGQVEILEEATAEFSVAYKDGDDDRARALYAEARMPWERIQPVAESFGDLETRLDLRESDLEVDQEWVGWHRIEKDLWPPADDSSYVAMSHEKRSEMAALLEADTAELSSRVSTLEIGVDQLSNGTKKLVDELATGIARGEEEIWSHTDLWDFQANIEGARVAFELVQPILESKANDQLSDTLDDRFESLQVLLDGVSIEDGFVYFDELSETQIEKLADALNALAEPLGELTSAVAL